MQDNQCTSNSTSILCILLKLLKIKVFLSENVLDAFINPKNYLNVKNEMFCVEELVLQKRSTYKPYLCILDKHMFLVSIYNRK